MTLDVSQKQTETTAPNSALGKKALGVSSKASGSRRFEKALFAYHMGEYSLALSEFEAAAEQAEKSADKTLFVESCTYILRILAEREEFSKIDRIENKVLQIVGQSDLGPKLKSRCMYVLGICSCYQETRHEQAMRRFREAIDYAMMAEDRSALAAPLYGAATVLYARSRYDDAIKELERLEVLLSCLELPEFNSASLLLRSMSLRNIGLVDEALSWAWKAFESLKHQPHLVLYLHTLTVLGTIFRQKGDLVSARIYLDLADRTLKRKEFPRIARLVDDAMASLGSPKMADADLVFDTRTGLLIEKIKGEIHFEGQFIIRDLLKAFLENPGRVFTKKELVTLVWKEDYAPEIHDNKIYVTIKRLRKLLESESNSTDYIMRAKNGYFLNPKTRVLINDQPVVPATDLYAGNNEMEMRK